MRIAIVHVWRAGGDVADRVWKSLCQSWPQANLFAASQRPTADPHAQASAPPRSGIGLPTAARVREQLIAGRIHNLGLPRPKLAGYDLVFSTRPRAANLVEVASGTPHVCYLPPLGIEELPRDVVEHDRTEPERIYSLRHFHETGHLAPEEAVSRGPVEAGEMRLPRGVTHFVASSHAVRERRLGPGPFVPVIYPPIDASFYRPGPQAREAFYLVMGNGLCRSGLNLAIEACRAAECRVVIVTDETPAPVMAVPDVVDVVSHPTPELLRDYYRRCRGLLAPSGLDFDPAVLEAQACGTPVVALQRGAALETILDAECAGFGTGLFFHEQNVWSLVSAIRELERRPHKFSASLGCAQAARFSTVRFEQVMCSYLENLVTSQSVQAPQRKVA